jgi:hypothetical protein
MCLWGAHSNKRFCDWLSSACKKKINKAKLNDLNDNEKLGCCILRVNWGKRNIERTKKPAFIYLKMMKNGEEKVGIDDVWLIVKKISLVEL